MSSIFAFRAFIKNENTGDCPWFVYVESRGGQSTYSCRFGHRSNAERTAAAMNKAWEQEGRLIVREGVVA